MATSRKLSPVMMVTIRPIPVDLWRRFKARAAREGVPTYRLLIALVSNYLKDDK